MAYKDFTPDEWQQTITLPQLAALYIILASPGRFPGIMKELIAATRQIVSALKMDSGNALVNAAAVELQDQLVNPELVAARETNLDQDDIRDRCLDACRAVGALLAQIAPEDAEGYQRWVYETAQASAAAAREGGFLGMGGVKVNIAEEDALYEIAAALGIPG